LFTAMSRRRDRIVAARAYPPAMRVGIPRRRTIPQAQRWRCPSTMCSPLRAVVAG
jgi:hypothetical protein